MSGRPPPSIGGMTSLKIDNLSYRTDTESLRRKFSKYGEIGDVYIPKDKYGESRGFAFVRFPDKRDAGDAIDQLDGRDIDGREIRVDYARHERPSFDKWRGSRRDRSRSRSRGRRRRSRSDSRDRRRRRSHSRSRSRSKSNGAEKRSKNDTRSRSRSTRRDSRSRSRSASRDRRSRSRSARKERSRSRSARRSRSRSGSR